MLVLSRTVNESINIGDDVVVTIVRVDGRTVRVGIEAPTETVVLRKELVDGIAARPMTLGRKQVRCAACGRMGVAKDGGAA